MQGAMRWMSISTGQASAGDSGTSKELSNSTETGSYQVSSDKRDNSISHDCAALSKALTRASILLRVAANPSEDAMAKDEPAEPGPGHNNPFADVVWERKTR